MSRENSEFAITGINHLALVCSDMERTVDFYTNVLGFPLMKTLDLPMDLGQHFFFDIGNGDSLAFFWFPNSPDGVPGVSSPGAMPMQGDIVTAVGSMNHVAFNVPAEKMEEYRDKLQAKGVKTTEVVNHDNSRFQISKDMNPDVLWVGLCLMLLALGVGPPSTAQADDVVLARLRRLPAFFDGGE